MESEPGVPPHAMSPRVRLYGGLTVEHEGARLDDRLPSRQARLLFALLALERGRALSREAIADALWSDVAPRSRDGSLRALLSGVRRVFGPESVVGRETVRLVLPPGTTIDVEEAEASLADAEAVLARGDPEGAARAARGARALVAEELLAGLDAPWIDERRAAAEELALRTLEVEARAALRGPRPPEAEPTARELVERAPYRESACGLLMEALAARGDLAEASLAFDRLRTRLREDLGASPAPAIVALHDRLLAGDPPEPVGARPSFPVALARAAERPLVARATERERLRGAWELTRTGGARLVLVGGEPGIGKTSLTARFARDAHDEGALVLLGRCHAEALVPYEPFVEALRQLPTVLLHEHAEGLGRVMPELASEGSAAGRHDDAAARHLLFDAVARAFTAVTDRPLVLVVEDLHWAEQPTLLLLRHVVRAAEQARLLVLATYRTTDAPGTERVVRTASDLAREGVVDRVPLAGLSDDEVAEMISALEGRPSSEPLGAAMRRDTAGNPLFVGQLLRHLEDSGVLVERDGELSLETRRSGLGVPESAQELVGARLAALAPDVATTLRTAAIIGRSFDYELVVAVEERPEGPVLDALEAGTTAGLVEEVGAGLHAFVHALVREAIYEQTGVTRRAALHGRVARTLEAESDADPAELAHHFLAAGDRAKGLDYAITSARRALDQLAYEEAAVHYEHALSALGDAEPERRCELLLALGDVQAREGDTGASKRTYREAAELAEELALPEQLARAAVGYGGRLLWEVSRDDPHLVPLLESALDRIGEDDGALRVRLLARLGGGPLRDSHDPRRRRAMTEEALAAARRLGDPSTLAYALDGYISAHHSPEHTPGQVALATELVDIALRAGDLERAIEGYEHRAAARVELGDLAGAAADVEAMAPLATRLRQAPQDWFVAERRAVQALHEGRLAEAEALSADALRIGGEALPWSAAMCHLLQLVVLRRLQGRLEEVEPRLRAAAEEDATTYPVCRCAHLHVLAALGHADEARAGLAALAPDAFGALNFDETWLAAVAFLAEAAHALGETAHAATLYTHLSPYADRVTVSTPEVTLGAVPRYLALLAVATGRPEEAATHFEDAVAFNERIGALPQAALALEEHAALTGDRALADRAVRAYAALGLAVLAERAERLVR